MSSDDTPAPAAVKDPAPIPPPFPNLPDPVDRINAYEKALQVLAAEERRVRDELAVKDPLESTADTLEAAGELLLLVQAIDKIKQERSAAIRRLARGY
ncbi:MAG: hypothetical protein ACJ74H_12230 [Thermoanaerobaculia bacterium]